MRGARSRVSPDDVGLPTTGPRRVPGLRREEVALLAGVSADYYVRLEQGRERTPSPQVVDALAVALRLDHDGRSHLYRLAGLAPRLATSGPVPAELVALVEGWPDNPALVFDRSNDVLAANRLARALFDEFAFSGNLMEIVFLDPAAHEFYDDWPAVAANSAAGFRLGHSEAYDDPRVQEVLHGLLGRSAEFRELWQANDARGKTLESKTFRHPEVGRLTLHMQAFDVRSGPGLQLVVYSADPGTPSAEALRLLGTLAATRDVEARRG
ncbi:helix-turn-helix domain-containing protein [Motilibacter peucedani]|uniref:helix-turn-helix domain-containing protein n=1 Tax=Motilibacter peucedani TaxID=598650 RepID=UPI0038B2B9CA